ncbi:MAG: methyltransferase domain-containing protein [Candidatus Micrarchaeota archaeon]
MKRVLEKPGKWTRKALKNYDRLKSLAIVDRHFTNRALDLCPKKSKLRLLDVASGPGQVLSLVPSGHVKHGIDLDPLAVEFAREKDKKTKYAVANSEQLPYRKGFFDLVMCHSLLHHLEEPRKTIEETLRVAKPGGAVFFRDLCRPESEEALQKILQDYAAGYDEENKRLFENSLRSSFTLREWKSLFPKDFHCSKISFYLVAEKPSESVKLELPGAATRLRFKRSRRNA